MHEDTMRIVARSGSPLLRLAARRSVHALLVLLAAPMVVCTGGRPPADPVARQGAHIWDQEHGGGTEGFVFLPPLVPAPRWSAVFEPGLAVAVQVDRLDPEGWQSVEVIARFSRYEGTGGVLVSVQADRYQVDWDTQGAGLAADETYRIRVLVPGGPGLPERELGHADVDVVDRGGELRRVDDAEYIPLLNGRTLPIGFRIARGVVDRDGDGTFDYEDVCPDVADPGQEDADGDLIGDACDVEPCDPADPSVTGVCTPAGSDAVTVLGGLRGALNEVGMGGVARRTSG